MAAPKAMEKLSLPRSGAAFYPSYPFCVISLNHYLAALTEQDCSMGVLPLSCAVVPFSTFLNKQRVVLLNLGW